MRDCTYCGMYVETRKYSPVHRTHANRVYLLIKVSLWVGEQFASDLGAVMPGMSIKCISSNKILSLLGQNLPGPQTGFDFSEETWDLTNTIVLIISHSGGTFAPLAVRKLDWQHQ